MIQTITWTGHAARLLDQTKLPTETAYLDIADDHQMWDAIRRLVVRGAPAIGVAAAFGAYLGVRGQAADTAGCLRRVNEVCDYLATSRPTAVNLFWALDRVRRVAQVRAESGAGAQEIERAMLDEAVAMLEEDKRVCRAIGGHGAELLAKLPRRSESLDVLTHCNAGALAAVRYGTALAPIYVGAEHGMKFHVWADETRPLLQGSRITAYELTQANIPVTVICDGMAASVMQQRKVAAVIVGADRVAANGDVANKIGTLGVAVLAKHFGIPFYVAVPTSTLDAELATGDQIPIEQRDGREISEGFGKPTAPPDAATYNPAFDVTPADLVSAIITEHGVIEPPFKGRLVELRRRS